jgi:hypothetical protein
VYQPNIFKNYPMVIPIRNQIRYLKRALLFIALILSVNLSHARTNVATLKPLNDQIADVTLPGGSGSNGGGSANPDTDVVDNNSIIIIDNIKYDLSDAGAVVTGLSDSSLTTELNIPASIEYKGTTYTVTSIGGSAFAWCTGLASVVIPNSVTTIGSSAFEGCTGLASVVIPNSVTTIGSSAFENCTGLASVVIPNSVTTIGSSAFQGCSSISELTIEDGDTELVIESSAFVGANVAKAYLGRNISTAIFTHTYLSSLTIGDKVTVINNYEFYGCNGLTSVVIPNSITSIGNSAFQGCSGLASVVIPNSVTSIGSSAFQGCSSIRELTIEDGDTELVIESSAFDGANMSKAYLGRNISTAIFTDTNLSSLTIGDKVTVINSYEFYGCNGLTSVVIPNSVTTIGDVAFADCNRMTSIVIGSSVTSIGGSAFATGFLV